MNPSATATPSQAPTTAARRQLVVRLRNWVGDVVLGLPALHALEAAGYQLTLVARAKWAPALLRGTSWRVLVQPAGLRARAAQLRALRFELAALDPSFEQRTNTLLLPQSFSSALEARCAGLKALGWAHEGRSFLLHRKQPLLTQGHVAHQYLSLAHVLLQEPLSAAQVLRELPHVQAAFLPVAADAERTATGLLRAHDVGDAYVVICPFAGGKSANRGLDKSWPHFAEFVSLAQRHIPLPMVIYPGPGEVDAAMSQYPTAICMSDSRLDVYAALMRRAALVIAIDTGPGHMAAALGAPLLSLIGPTLPEHWQPLGPCVELALGYPQWPTAQHILERAQAILARRAGHLAQGDSPTSLQATPPGVGA